jgi:hypothetical protein
MKSKTLSKTRNLLEVLVGVEKPVSTSLEDELFEMANFHPDDTGLRQTVWFSGDPVGRHNRPRGKIRVEGKFYPFSIDNHVEWLAGSAPGVSTKDFKRLAEFIELNRLALLAYWNGEISTPELVRQLKKL